MSLDRGKTCFQGKIDKVCSVDHRYKPVQDIPRGTQDLTLTEYTVVWLSSDQGVVQNPLGGLILLIILSKGRIAQASSN